MKYLALAALAFALPVHATDTKGFTAGDLAAAARAGRPDAALADAREHLAQTETLRAAFVLSPAGAWTLLSADEARTLRLAFGGQRPLGDGAVQWFMRGASGVSNGDGLTGLYNPIADVWLTLRWQRIGGSMRIVDAAFTPGALVRDSDDDTPWTEAPGAYADALAHGTAAARISFRGLPGEPFFRTTGPIRGVAADQAFATVTRWMETLRPWGEDKTRLAQWKTMHRQLAEGKVGGTLADLPPRVRATLAPMAAITRPDGVSLLLMSPLAPNLVVAADYGADGKGEPGWELVNLANATTGEVK
ncbi:MAG: hypothetical protein WDN06_17055 [Asticcacaulis sp.]